jgi:hypothetical protein
MRVVATFHEAAMIIDRMMIILSPVGGPYLTLVSAAVPSPQADDPNRRRVSRRACGRAPVDGRDKSIIEKVTDEVRFPAA